MEIEYHNRTLTFIFATPVKNRASGIFMENHHRHYTSHLIIIRIIISTLIVKTLHNVEACWWVQSPNREIWDLGRAILPHLHVLGQCGAHLVKVNININTTSKLTNFGTFLAMVNLNFNTNINVTSISWAGQ